MTRPRLTRALVLETPTETADGAGGFTRGWTALGTLWADVAAGSGREVAVSGRLVSATGYRIVVRAAPVGSPARPRPDQRFRDGARVFTILSVAEGDAGARYLTCITREEVPT